MSGQLVIKISLAGDAVQESSDLAILVGRQAARLWELSVDRGWSYRILDVNENTVGEMTLVTDD